MRVLNPMLCAILLLPGASLAAGPDFPAYAVTDLKALGIWPVAMNGRGEVVGTACCGRQSTGAQLYRLAEVRDLGLPAGYLSFTPKAINDSGWIAGNALSSSPQGSYYEPPYDAAFHDGDGWTVIDTSSLGRTANVVGINEAGKITGNSGPELFMPNTPWLHDRGRLVQLGPSSTSLSTATDINDFGQVAGYFGPTYSPGSVWSYRDGEWQVLGHTGMPVAVNEAGTMLVTGPHFAGTGSTEYLLVNGIREEIRTDGCWPWPQNPGEVRTFHASALNDRDEVAGSGAHACLYSGSRSIDLGTLAGDDFSSAKSLNNRTQVAGVSWDSQGRRRLFVYEDGVMLDVADLSESGSALQLGDADQVSVTINDAAYLLVIALDTAKPDTLEAAYLLTPIAPTATLTALPGIVPIRTSVTLAWSSQNANSCVATGGVTGDGWAGTRPTSGQATVTASVAGTVSYSLRCTAGPLSVEAIASVAYAPAPPDVRLSVAPTETRVRNEVTLAWTSEGAESCAATGGRAGDGWTGPLATSGQLQVTEAKRGVVEYGISCTAYGLTSEAKVSVTYKGKSGGGALDLLGVVLLGLGVARRRVA